MTIALSTTAKDRFRAPIDTTTLKVEVLFSGTTWTDITDWVEAVSGTKEEVSQLSGGASANSLNLTLINIDGRFSAKNTAGPYYGNLTPNKPVRVSAVASTESVRIFDGFTGPWPTQAKARTCQVAAQDLARLLLRRDIVEETVFNETALTTGYYLTKVLERAAWLSGLRWDAVTTKTDTGGNSWAFSSHDGTAIAVTKSAGAVVATYSKAGVLVMQLDLVDLLIPVAPLKGKALAVLDQIAKVVDGRVYFESQGQLVFRCPMYRNDSTLVSAETFTVDNLEDVLTDQNYENSRFSALINRAEVTSTPFTFRTDATGAVVEESIPFKGDLFARFHFNAGESYPGATDAELWCELPNGLKIAKTSTYPTAANVVLETADKADPTKPGTGLKLKAGFPVFEQTRMKVAFENLGSVAEVIRSLTVKARLMRPVQKCRAIRKNDVSISLYDQRDWSYNNDLIPHATACENLAAWKVVDGKDPKTLLTLKAMHGVPWLEINDRITVSETVINSLPAPEDFIVKRIPWSWTLAGFLFSIEACTPSPNFTVSALPATAVKVETSNQNQNGNELGSLPPQVIDGAQTLVGLNNIPAFYGYTNGIKKLGWAGMSYSRGFGFDGSDIYVTAGSIISAREQGILYKIDTMSGAQLATLAASTSGLANGVFNDIQTISGKYLFAHFTDTDTFDSYILGVDLTTLTAFAIKAKIPAGYACEDILTVGGKLFMVARNTSVGSHEVRLYVWNTINLTRQDAADVSYQVVSGSQSEARFAFDGRNLAIALDNQSRVDLFDTQTNTLTASWITLDAGEMAKGIVSDGRSWFVNSSRFSWTSDDPKLLRFYSTPSGMKRDSKQYGPATGKRGGSVIFDGTYIWTTIGDKLVQLATNLDVIAEFPKGDTTAGPLAFDGSAIWVGLDLGKVGRVPRLPSSRLF